MHDPITPLVPFHRTVKLPPNLWAAVRSEGKRRGASARRVIADALDAELSSLTTELQSLGLDGGHDRPQKAVRLQVDDNLIGRLNCGRRRTGIPAVQLLMLCLQRHVQSSGGVVGQGR